MNLNCLHALAIQGYICCSSHVLFKPLEPESQQKAHVQHHTVAFPWSLLNNSFELFTTSQMEDRPIVNSNKDRLYHVSRSRCAKEDFQIPSVYDAIAIDSNDTFAICLLGNKSSTRHWWPLTCLGPSLTRAVGEARLRGARSSERPQRFCLKGQPSFKTPT